MSASDTHEVTGAGRFAYWGGWAAIIVVPLYLVLGRGLLGSELGWLSVIIVFLSWIIVPAMAVPPILTLFDPPVRRTRSARTVYSYAAFTLWTGVLLFGIAFVDNADDAGGAQSALMRWSGGAISTDSSQAIAGNAGLVALAAYLVMVAFAIAGIVRGRRARAASRVGAAVR